MILIKHLHIITLSDYSWEWAAICLQWSFYSGATWLSTGVYLLWKWKHITHHAHLHRTHCNVASIHIISLPKDNWTDGYSWEPWMRLWCSFYVCVCNPVQKSCILTACSILVEWYSCFVQDFKHTFQVQPVFTKSLTGSLLTFFGTPPLMPCGDFITMFSRKSYYGE